MTAHLCVTTFRLCARAKASSAVVSARLLARPVIILTPVSRRRSKQQPTYNRAARVTEATKRRRGAYNVVHFEVSRRNRNAYGCTGRVRDRSVRDTVGRTPTMRRGGETLPWKNFSRLLHTVVSMTDEASPAKTVVDVLVQRALACAMLALKQGAPEEAQRRCSEALEGERGGSCRPEVLAAVLAERSAASAAMLDCEQALEDARESLRVKATAQARALVQSRARTRLLCATRQPV